MTAFSDYYENQIINHMLRNVAFTTPTTTYLALFLAITGLEENAPTAEVSSGAYARQICVLNSSGAGASENTSLITFPTATANWGTVSHWCLTDHVSNTAWGTNVNVLMYAAVSTSKAVNIGDIAKVNAGDLDISVA